MRGRGFTLLEVLAAIAVLALVYTALAQAAMQGLAHEGDASRRLRASLLADQVLSEIEAQLAANVAPSVGLTETEDEDQAYAIAVEVRPFDLGAFALAAAETAAAQRGQPGVGEAPNAAGGPALQLLTAPPGAPPPLLEIDVTVRWLEGADEQLVTRTTFAADPAIVGAALASLPSAGAEGQDTGDGELAPGGEPGAGPGAGAPEPDFEPPGDDQ